MKKFAVIIILTLVFANGASAFSWDDISGYASDTWDGIVGYVAGWFTDEEPEPSKDNAPDNALPDNIAGKWDKLSVNLNEALTLREKQETLPDSTWLPFREDKESNSKKINAILDRALEILSGGDAGNVRASAVGLRTKITSLRNELDDLRNKRINAPESTYFFWVMTKEKTDAAISAKEKEIERTESELNAMNSQLTEELRKIGLELTDSQTEILLNSVTGEDILQNTVIFDNVKAVVTKLEELSQNDSNTLEITKRYTGMYLVLNDLLIHTEEELIRKMDNEYRPRLREIMNESEMLRKDALSKSNNKAYTPEQRRAFAQNAKSNATTVEAAKLYGELLDSQRASVLSSIRSLKLNRDLAENTYRTIRSSGELRGLIHTGLNVFDAIGKLSMPELKTFESGIMREEFDEINRRLKR